MKDLHAEMVRIRFSSGIYIHKTEKCPKTGQTPLEVETLEPVHAERTRQASTVVGCY